MSTNYIQMVEKLDKLPIFTDNDTLDMYCEYLLNDGNRAINFANLSNLKEYVDMFNGETFNGVDTKVARFEFIKYYLEARLTHGVMKRDLCINYVKKNVSEAHWKVISSEIIDSIAPDCLSSKDIAFINDMVFAQLNVIFMHRYKVGLTQLIEDINSNEFGKSPESCRNAIQFMQKILTDLTKAQRRSRQDNRFNLSDANHFRTVMLEACERILSNAQFWSTGIQGLDKMLNGGLEDARCYNFIGSTGGFKSGVLLNIMKGVKLFNKGHGHKFPNKRPTILFLSQENNIWETIERIFGIFGNATSIRNYSIDEIMEILRRGGFGVVTDEQDIDIEFRYYGNMDIGVPDIQGIVEELDAENREVVVIIQDYIERLRPPVHNVDRRIQLNDISNQLHDAAVLLDVPIVTASQFNRNGAETIEVMRAADKVDIGKNVGMKDISESYGMLKNFDANIGIVVEYDKVDERFYLSFRSLKYRGDDSNSIAYFLQPFVGKNSKIQLVTDHDEEEPMYRTSLVDGMYEAADQHSKDLNDLAQTKFSRIMSPGDDEESPEEIFMKRLVQDETRSELNIKHSNPYYSLNKDPRGFYRLSSDMVNEHMSATEKKIRYREMYSRSVGKIHKKFINAGHTSNPDFDIDSALSSRKKKGA